MTHTPQATSRIPTSGTSNADADSATAPADSRRLGPAGYPQVFVEGDRAQITDPKGRLHTITLVAGGRFQTNRGFLDHDLVLGQPDGQVVTTEQGATFQVVRPRLVDYVMSMPRGATIVYPKDAAQIVAEGDIFAGARVLEAGVGSGALTLSLLNAVGPDGFLQSVELRPDFADIAQANVDLWFGGRHPAWDLAVADLADFLQQATPGSFDRVVLDMLDPWTHVGDVADVLVPGGVLTCYVATVSQLSTLAEALKESERFTEPDSWESLVRPWHLEGLSVRPEHRMVAHSGFLLTARVLAPATVPLQQVLRPAPAKEGQEPQWSPRDEWTEDAVGARVPGKRKLRRVRGELQRKVQTWLGSNLQAEEASAQQPNSESGDEANGSNGQ